MLPALRITLIYLALAALWIVLSDRVADVFAPDHEHYVTIQTWKGWFFVATTAALLFFLVQAAIEKLRHETREQQHLSNALAVSRSIQAEILGSLDDAVWMLDLHTHQYLFMNAAVESIYGVSPQFFMANRSYWLDCVYNEDRHIAGQPARLIGIATDISALRQNVERIHQLSNYDALTGLPNRAMLEKIMGIALEAARQGGKRVGLLYLDIARLQDVNDTYGHAVGDEVLRRFATRLRENVGPMVPVARPGADEFAAVLPELTDGAQAGTAAQKILDALMAPLALSIGELRIGASVGISLFPVDAETPATLLQHAGLALHEAKSRGAGQLCFYEPAMNALVVERVALMRDLHSALEQGELHLDYQPQVELASGRVVGVEALMRWHHPERGKVPPAQFIPLAEESGLIVPMGAWAIDEACRQNAAWRKAGLPHMVVAVNISAVQFRTANLRDTTARALALAQLEPPCLELEVTESIVMGSECMLHILDELRELGVQLSIDDFGTGYSSLSYLTRFPVNKLKIDRAFVHGALLHERDSAIVGIIVQMAKMLHLRVIAEGVETAEQIAMLKRYGCDEAQGYFYAPPMPAEAVEAFLRERG
jgi:diguanylate cyclase (GGDEF)-like protein